MAQFERCRAVCTRADSAACSGLDLDVCEQYCIALENETVNNRCADVNDRYIECLTSATDVCAYPSRQAAECRNEFDAVKCCFLR
jgi:hypothetical protein